MPFLVKSVGADFTFLLSDTLIMSSNTANLESSEYDFVIVGGGLSGLVVASRLTENKNVRVLVLEAGANRVDDLRIKCQGLALSTYFNPDFDWCMVTEPQVSSRQVLSPDFDCMHNSKTNAWSKRLVSMAVNWESRRAKDWVDPLQSTWAWSSTHRALDSILGRNWAILAGAGSTWHLTFASFTHILSPK